LSIDVPNGSGSAPVGGVGNRRPDQNLGRTF
jgi:hypothetical protein